MRIKYVDLQKSYPVKLGEALPWRYPASCSSGETGYGYAYPRLYGYYRPYRHHRHWRYY